MREPIKFMGSLQGIPVESKLDTFNMPFTGTTLCHPQHFLCRFDAQLSSRHLALNSPLGHFNGDNAHSPPDAQNSRWLQSSIPLTATWLSLNYGEHNPSHVRRYTLPSQPSHNSISSPYSQSFLRDLQHQKQTQYSMLQIKTILKTHFDYRHLISSSSFYFSQPSEEVIKHKHAHHNSSSLNNNKQIYRPNNNKP